MTSVREEGGDVPQTEARERIVFPLDFGSPEEAVGFAARLRGHVGLFKVGFELFVAAGPSLLRRIAGEEGSGIFLDLKFHDIPATVRSASREAARLGARFITVHAGGGVKMMEAAVEGAGGRTGVLAVTALTSLGREELAEVGMRRELTDPSVLVLHRAGLAKAAGCAGVVCSGQEVQAVRRECGDAFVTMVPGIRPAWGEVPSDDQARVATPADAVRQGADYLVIGRPIRLAPDPAAAADRIAEEIAGRD
jgi:orotidine-5'-phosphate decarboxylase